MWPKSPNTLLFGRNRPNPFLPPILTQPRSVGQNPVLSVEIDQNHFFRAKWTKTTPFGQKPVFLAKINQDPFSRSTSATTRNPFLSGQGPSFSVKVNRNPFFFVWSKPSFSQSKATQTTPLALATNDPNQCDRWGASFSGPHCPEPFFQVETNRNHPKPSASSSVLIPSLD